MSWLAGALDVSRERLVLVQSRKDPSSVHWIVDCRYEGKTERVFIKRHALEELYTQERDALTTLASYSSEDEPFAVPRMLAFSDRHTCIALAWIEGASIAKPMRAAVGRLAPREAVARGAEVAHKVGEWLRRLQSRTAGAHCELPADAMTIRFETLLRTIEAGHPALTRESRRLLRAFERELAEARPESSCLVHNDFWFDHIWLRNGQVVVLDWGRARMGPAGRDAVQFHCRLVDMVLNPLVSRKASREVESSFLDGYGGLDFTRSINRMWRLWTRAEQLAGLIESAQRAKHGVGLHRLWIHALSRELRAAAE